MKKIVHIISGLDSGGAEMMLYKLLKNSLTNEYNFEVISMTDKGVLGEKIEDMGIQVHCLKLRRGVPSLKAVLQTIKIIKNADIVQSWMYHADLLAFICTRFVKSPKLIWGLRRSSLELGQISKKTLYIAKINSRLSKYVDKIISCSEAGTANHIAIGYCEDKIVTIPNGFELDKFKRVSLTRTEINNLYGRPIKENTRFVAVIARWNPIKNHELLFDALNKIEDFFDEDDYKLVLCGSNMQLDNADLISDLKKFNLQERTILLGRRDDIPRILSTIDILVSPSKSEGFSNVIGEGMASECICLVTDVGDSKFIVGEYGYVVPPNDSENMGNLLKLLIKSPKEKRLEIGKCARHRIIKNFDIKKIQKEYFKIYSSILK